MPRDRNVLRIDYVSNIKQLLRRIFYTKPQLVDYALIILEKIKRNELSLNNVNSLSKELGISYRNINYILKKLQQLKIIRLENDKYVISNVKYLVIFVRETQDSSICIKSLG